MPMESYAMDPVVQRKDNTLSQNNLDHDSNENETERKGPKKTISRFFHYTTINGLQRLASAGTILGRLFWLAVVLGAAAMFSKDIYDLVKQYYERPVSVVSKIEYFRGMQFPAITFCNVNPIRKDKYKFSAKLKDKIEERDNDTCFREDLRGKNSKCEEDKDEEEEFDNEIDHILSNIDEKELIKSGHQQDQFIVSCRFNGKRCRNKKYWVQFWDPHYGNCFTLNSLLLGHDPNISSFQAKKPGSSYGLKIVFNIELNEYIPQLTKDAGIKVSITERDEMPFPIYNSLSLAPGFNNEIAMKRTKIARIDRFSNGSCQTSRQLQEKNPYRIKYGAGYSVQACLQYCYAQAQIEKCGCAEYSFFGAVAPGKICDETDQTADDCIDKWKDAGGSCEKNCADSCSETIYESSLTFTKWPYEESVETVLESLGFNYSDYGENINNIRGNFLAANIFFKRFRETKIEESLSYQTVNLLADIGGQVGLWAGLSVISMCELLELAVLLFRNFFQRDRIRDD